MKHIEKEYTKFLFHEIGLFKRGGPDYFILAGLLHNIDFRYTVPNDENRARDGLYLRELFGINSLEDKPCSFLEMLIGLARRFNSMHIDCDEGSVGDYFFEMLHNVTLDIYTDDTFSDPYVEDDVRYIIDTIMDRTYDRDGKQGLFPLNNPRKDQRKVELWYQLSSYLLEKYPENYI